jgi:pterin-4a-carbinolamine dehydratase
MEKGKELTSIDQTVLQEYLVDWQRFEDEGILKLHKKYTLSEYKDVLELVQQIGGIAESHNHHPKLIVEYKSIDVHWWSHDISQLSKRDYICAGAIDVIIQKCDNKNILNNVYKFPINKYVPSINKKPKNHMDFYHLLSNKHILNEHNFKKHSEFLYGIDLFNAGYFWETHEVLEDVWNQAGRKSELARAVQSIIFFAAAKLKQLKNDNKSATKHFASAKSYMPSEYKKFLGINLEQYFLEIEKNEHNNGVISKITMA